MEEVTCTTAEDNRLERQKKTHCEGDVLNMKTPSNTENVVVESENVRVEQRIDINCDTNETFKKENCNNLSVEGEDREVQEDDNSRENQGRRIISTLTSKHYAGHVRVFKEWLKGKGLSEEFEEWEPKVISEWLSEFYKESHLKHGGTKKVSSLKIIRAAIDHHLKSIPYCKSYSLTHSPQFSKANTTLVDLEAAQREFLDFSDSNFGALQLTVDDIRKLWTTGVVGIKTPKSLQHLVFLGIGINFGITSRDDLRDLKPSMFEFHIDEKSGLEYTSCNLGDPVSTQLKKNKNKCSGRKMFSVPGSLQCPVAALKVFLKRRNPACSAFFQIPNCDFELSGQWYRAQPAGVNSLSRMLKDMSQHALLSMEYSNHTLRSTPPIILYKAMEDVPCLRLPRVITQEDLNNKIALNSRRTDTALSSVSTFILNNPPVNEGTSCTFSSPTESSAVKAVSNHIVSLNNVGSPTGDTTNSNIPQNLHQVFCISEKWNMKDIIMAINAGDALVITKQSKKREQLQTHENDEVALAHLREDQQQVSDVFQSVGRDRCGRKQPKPKRFCRDPFMFKEELTKDKIEDGFMEVINGMKTGLQSFEDLVTKQRPSDQAIQELSLISDCIQELLEKINTNGMVVQ